MGNDRPNRNDEQPTERRSFLVRFSAAVLTLIALIAPFAAAIGIAVDPLVRRKRAAAGDTTATADSFLRVGSLAAIPADGVPRLYVLSADRSDGWTRIKNERVGTVYLSRDDAGGTPRVTAFTALCPHSGCTVGFNPSEAQFVCPCHGARFAADGA